MAPFGGVEATSDLHYGVVVNDLDVSHDEGFCGEEEASTSPLLHDMEAGETDLQRHHASIEAEHRKFQQEALQIRSAKHSFCCIKILLAVTLLPTMFLLTALTQSFLVMGLSVVSAVVFYRCLDKKVSTTVLGLVLMINFASLYCYHSLEWLDDKVLIPFAFLNFVAARKYSHHTNRGVASTADTEMQSKLRQKELFFTYMGTIKSVANGVYNSNPQQKTTELREFFSTSPLEGFYTTTEKARNENATQLFLLFPPSESPKGWWIRGARKSTSDGSVQSVLLEGFVSPTHEAFWTEGTLDGKENTLYYGKFGEEGRFQGEWMNYKGKRCHPLAYTLGLASAANDQEHFGAMCDGCGRKALPGTCYAAKTKACYYCHSCVENNGALVNEEEFVALQLPEVSRQEGGQHYDPPCTSNSAL